MDLRLGIGGLRAGEASRALLGVSVWMKEDRGQGLLGKTVGPAYLDPRRVHAGRAELPGVGSRP